MSWLDRVSEVLAPLSIEQADVREMLAEWYYTGNAFDLDEPVENCQLCGHPEIRYQFEIRNEHTEFELLVGSECIKKFRISAVDESGDRLDADESKQKVDRDRNKLITDAKQRRVINALVQLSMQDDTFQIESFIEYYREREAFTPNQLKVIIWRLNKHNVDFQHADFRMSMRRDREKSQLHSMEGWQVKQIWQCMSPSQRNWYIEKFGEPSA